MSSLLIQRVSNGFIVVHQGSSEEPAVFITLKEMLNYVAMSLGDIDTEFNIFEQQIEIVERRHEA